MAGYRTTALAVSSAMFMQLLDSTALNTAIPAMARDFAVPAIDLNIAILAYQLAQASFIPIGNLLARRIGPRNAFLGALVVFMIGSVLCASARTLPPLIAARILQGLGGSVMMPVSRQLVVRTAAKNELVSAMNWLLIPGIMGPLLGPPVGGFIVTYSSWHWIFWINVPAGLFGLIMTLAVVPDIRDETKGRFDLLGLLLVIPTICCLVIGLDTVSRPDSGWLALALLAGSLVFGLLYLRHAETTPFPAIDLSLLSVGSFRQAMLSGALIRILAGATGFLMPLWFQLGMGLNAAQSGGLMIASTLGALLTRFIAIPLMRVVHPRHIAIAGTAILVVAVLLTASLRPGFPLPVFYLVLVLQGLMISTPLLVIGAAAYVDITPEQTGAATGFYTTVQQLTLSLGVTAAVCTVGAMQRFAHFAASDNATYSGSLIILSLLAVVALWPAWKLDKNSIGALRAGRQQEATGSA